MSNEPKMAESQTAQQNDHSDDAEDDLIKKDTPLPHLPSVGNFRPIRGTLLYRSSKLDQATEPEIRRIKDMGVYSIVDLRAPNRLTPRPIDQFYTPYLIRGSKKGSVEYQRVFPQDQGLAKKEDGDSTEMGSHYFIDVLSLNYGIKIMRRVAWYIQIYLVLLFIWDWIFSTTYALRELVKRVVNPGGIRGLNQDILTYCGLGLRDALRLLIMPDNVPGVILCALGKDRTGIMSALIQAVCDVPHDQIIADYAESAHHLKDHQDLIKKDLFFYGLDHCFAGSEAEIMKELLQFIREKYGTVGGYLASIGFSRDEQLKLRANVSSLKTPEDDPYG